MTIAIGAPFRVLVIGLVVALGATACMGTSASDATDASPSSCDEAVSVSQSTPTVAVLGQVGKATEYYAGDFDVVTKGAEAMKAHVIVNGVASDATAPSLVANTVLVGDGVNQMDRTNDLDCKRTLVKRSFSQTLHDRPNPQPLDDFAAIKTLEGNLVGTPKSAGISVVLFTSLLNASQPIDLSGSEVSTDPAIALNTLAAQRLLPNCSGWRVYAVGGDQQLTPPLDNAQAAELREFWRQYFERCGGALVAWSTHLDAFPISGGAIASADTTQVPVHREPGKVTADLAGDVLFDPGLADLRPAANDQLNQVLQLANQASGQVVVDGYTDVGGNEADNLDLSQRRCTSIQAWLVQHGVSPTRIAVQVHGSSNPLFANPVTDKEHQANRRVEVTIFE
jgi:outer membrane protein OmpA-like peptidoglycan-associated protein